VLENNSSQKDALISQLQARINTIESTIIDISAFKKQALEINEGLQIAQQNFYESLEIIQKHYHVINNSLQIIADKEKESITARSKFQELIVWKKNLNIPGLVPFSEIEQLKGEMALKSWENSLEERKILAKEAKVACLNALLVVDVEMTEIDLGDVHSFIGTIEVDKRKENLKRNRERMQNTILQVNQVNLQVLNDLLVKQSLQYQNTQQVVVKVQKSLPLVHKKAFTFELNVNMEPSKFVVALLNLHTQYKDQQKTTTSTSK
jgi:hypothetical protein